MANAGIPFVTNITLLDGTPKTAPTNGQLYIGKTDGTFALATLTQGSNVTITNGNGTITIAAAGASQTPWTSDIDAANHSLINAGSILSGPDAGASNFLLDANGSAKFSGGNATIDPAGNQVNAGTGKFAGHLGVGIAADAIIDVLVKAVSGAAIATITNSTRSQFVSIFSGDSAAPGMFWEVGNDFAFGTATSPVGVGFSELFRIKTGTGGLSSAVAISLNGNDLNWDSLSSTTGDNSGNVTATGVSWTLNSPLNMAGNNISMAGGTLFDTTVKCSQGLSIGNNTTGDLVLQGGNLLMNSGGGSGGAAIKMDAGAINNIGAMSLNGIFLTTPGAPGDVYSNSGILTVS